MTAATRRLWLYGLLLLLPALAVGGLALGLLAREQARLAEREEAARATRLAAVETRARLIAENIELLLGDVQSALMTTLQGAPAEDPRAFLSDWRASNPLVRGVFRSTADGRIVWGDDAGALRGWLAEAPPWKALASSATEFAGAVEVLDGATNAQAASPLAAAAAGETQARMEQGYNRGDISSNVLGYQRARQEIQGIAMLNSQAPVVVEKKSAPPIQATAKTASPEAVFSDGGIDAMRVQDFATGAHAVAPPPQSAPASAPVATREPEAGDSILRSGWTPWRDARRNLHLMGWRELPDRTVIGLELELDAIKKRFSEVLPTVSPGERYGVGDSVGGGFWSNNLRPPVVMGVTTIPVSVSNALLPGWEVRGELFTSPDASSAGVFAPGAAIVGLLVLTIVASSLLLLRQVRLSEAEAALKTSFVANVSHELKTPLTTIRLYAELLAQGRVRDEVRRADYLATIGQETQRLARLVGNVLDFSRLEQGRKKYERAGFDLAADLRRLAEIHGQRLAAAGLNLRLDLPENLEVTTDRDAVEQIVLNLLDNACKYAAEGGEATLSLAARGPGGGVELRVADRGPGVPAEQRERIFEKFHRVDDRLTAEKGGAGLGLSIARQLARGLGGDLAHRPRPGGGSEFVLTLPT